MSEQRAKVIPVDFKHRRRLAPEPPRRAPSLTAHQVLDRSRRFLMFCRPPTEEVANDYLGGPWDWGWTVFVWTDDAGVGPVWANLVGSRGYAPRHLTRMALLAFLEHARDVGGLLIDGELDGDGHVIRADAEQLIRRDDALLALGR